MGRGEVGADEDTHDEFNRELELSSSEAETERFDERGTARPSVKLACETLSWRRYSRI